MKSGLRSFVSLVKRLNNRAWLDGWYCLRAGFWNGLVFGMVCFFEGAGLKMDGFVLVLEFVIALFYFEPHMIGLLGGICGFHWLVYAHAF
jgi:hypothetical protein